VRLVFEDQGWEDYTPLEAWSTTNPKMLSKIIGLIAETTRLPRTATGKPERLKHLSGEIWSRRITEKDRLVYDFQHDAIAIIACSFHYDDHSPQPGRLVVVPP
jgi:toxin YoeB